MPLPRAAAVLLAAAVLAGCGGGEPTAAVTSRGAIAVTLDDFLIEPQDITARPGPVTFTVTNRGGRLIVR
jgi:ABC-type glycerol-3-phosphate transport system substrate-binding protein